MKLSILVMAGSLLTLASQGESLSQDVKGKHIIDRCVNKIQQVDDPKRLKSVDRVHVYLKAKGFDVVFGKGRQGRTDYFDNDYRTIITCSQNSKYDVVLLKAPLEDPVFSESPSTLKELTEVIDVGGTQLTFSYLKGKAIFVESVLLPETLKAQNKWLKEQEKRWTKKE